MVLTGGGNWGKDWGKDWGKGVGELGTPIVWDPPG